MKTKDYSKVKYVKPSVDGTDITKGNVYEFEYDGDTYGWSKNDRGQNLFINIPESSHIEGEQWIPCDKNGNEI